MGSCIHFDKKARSRLLLKSAWTAVLLLALPFAGSWQAIAQAAVQCEVALGDKKASKGHLKSLPKAEARLTCGNQAFDMGLADDADVTTFEKKGDHLVLLTENGRQRLIVFRKNPSKKTEGAKKFRDYEVVERSVNRAIIDRRAFEERGAVVIFHRGGP